MNFKTFLKLVEIQTKLASLFPFLLGTLFVLFRFGYLKPLNTAVFFASMLIFDMATTAINNYMDYQKATDNHDFDYRKTRNIIGQENLSERLVATVIIVMLIVATLLGFWLVYLTDLLVLSLGILCFGIGVFYTYGPLPLSRLPLGEVFSGVVMGLGITFLAVYVNVYDTGLLLVQIQEGRLIAELQITEFFSIFLLSLPAILTISNLMLANNICDVDEDVRNHRFTLAYYLGNAKAVRMFEWSYYGAYASIILAVILGIFHPFMLAVLLTLVPVSKHIQLFKKRQIKSETFIVAVKNMVLINGSMVAAMLISLIL